MLGPPPVNLETSVVLLIRYQPDGLFVGKTAKPTLFGVAPDIQYLVAPEGMKPPGPYPRVGRQRGIFRYSVCSHNVYLLVGVVHQVVWRTLLAELLRLTAAKEVYHVIFKCPANYD